MSGGAAVLEASAAIARLGLPVPRGGGDRRDREPAVGPLGQARRHRARHERRRRSRSSTRTPRAGSCSPTASPTPSSRAPSGWSTSPRSPGAIVTALRRTYAGLFGADDDWCAAVDRRRPARPASWCGGCRCTAEYAEAIEGRYADLVNAVETRKAGSIVAAEFLAHFTGDVPWAHLDIAGTAGTTRAAVRAARAARASACGCWWSWPQWPHGLRPLRRPRADPPHRPRLRRGRGRAGRRGAGPRRSASRTRSSPSSASSG